MKKNTWRHVTYAYTYVTKPIGIFFVGRSDIIKYILKARSKQFTQLNLIQSELKEGNLLRIDFEYSEVFVGEGIIHIVDNKCYDFAYTENWISLDQ